jgi:sugar phosphate isomerase/epimerase
MLLSANMIRFFDAFGMKKTFDIFAAAGIQGFDFNADAGEYYTDVYDRAYYEELRTYAQEKGITMCQAHAPFPSSFKEEEKNEKRFEEIVQGMKNAAYFGAPMIVVHPCCHLPYDEEGNAEKLFAYNLDFYRRLIPYARELGIRIAIENIGKSTVTSSPERLNRLYDTLNDPVFTICFDVGHSLIEEVDPADAIRAIGHRLVDGCTHIHDNFGTTDAHTLPFYGSIDWESVMKALADIGYRGNLNYEASTFLKGLPVELRPDGLAFMAKVGLYLVGRFEYYRSLVR